MSYYHIIYVSGIFQIFVKHFHIKNSNKGANKLLFSSFWSLFKISSRSESSNIKLGSLEEKLLKIRAHTCTHEAYLRM